MAFNAFAPLFMLINLIAFVIGLASIGVVVVYLLGWNVLGLTATIDHAILGLLVLVLISGGSGD